MDTHNILDHPRKLQLLNFVKTVKLTHHARTDHPFPAV